MRACCDHATAGAGTRNRRVLWRVFERHGGGENKRAGALLRARQRQGRALSGGRRPRRQAMDRHRLHQQQAAASGVDTARRGQAR